MTCGPGVPATNDQKPGTPQLPARHRDRSGAARSTGKCGTASAAEGLALLIAASLAGLHGPATGAGSAGGAARVLAE